MVIQFSFENFPYFLLFSLFNFAHLQGISMLEKYPQILFPIIDSLCLIFMVIMENINMMIDSYYKKKNDINLITFPTPERVVRFKFKVVIPLQTSNYKIRILLFTFLGVLSLINSLISYILFWFLFVGYIGVYCFFNIILSWLLLMFWANNTNMYRHHLCALVLLLCALITAIVVNRHMFNDFFIIVFGSSYWFLIGSMLLIVLSISCREVTETYILGSLSYEPYKMLFYEGIGSFFFSMILFGFLQLVHCENDFQLNLHAFCYHSQINYLWPLLSKLFSYESSDSLYIWMYIISTITMNIFRVLINKRHGPTHRYSADIFGFVIFMLLDIINSYCFNQVQFFTWPILALMPLLIIGCLIYNENIIIHICSLDTYTRKEIEQRAINDSYVDPSWVSLIE